MTSARRIWTPCLRLRLLLRLLKKPWGSRLIKPRKILLPFTLVSMVLAGCGKKSSQADENGGTVPEVTVARVERASISQNLIVSGNLTALPNRDAKVAALVPGRIARVLVVEGSQVKED